MSPPAGRTVRIHRNQLPLRILGTLTGLGFLGIGAYALLGGGPELEPYVRGRANGFALATIVAGIWAIAVSWLDRDLLGVWCKAPRRWR